MIKPVYRADGTIDPHGHLRQDIADAIRERLEASEMRMPGVEPPQPWMNEPEFDGQVSIYELTDAVLSAVIERQSAPRPGGEIADEITASEGRCTSTGAGNNRRCELPAGHHGLHENNEFFGLKWANLPGDPADAGPVRPDKEQTA